MKQEMPEMVNQHTNIKFEKEAVAKNLSISMAVCTKRIIIDSSLRYILKFGTETIISIEKSY